MEPSLTDAGGTETLESTTPEHSFTYFSLDCSPVDSVAKAAHLDTTELGDESLSGSSEPNMCSRKWELDQFNSDLDDWVMNFSEVFHFRIFYREFIGQFAFSLLGPLSLPLNLLMYHSKAGLINRGFLKGHRAFVTQMILWASQTVTFIVLAIYGSMDLTAIEIKLFCFALILRNCTIAIKYASMTTSQWEKLNREIVDRKILDTFHILSSWLDIKPDVLMMNHELAMVYVVGSRTQRCMLNLKFMGWPNNSKELHQLRHRLDFTSRTLHRRPSGRMLSDHRFHRKPEMIPVATVFNPPEQMVDETRVKFDKVSVWSGHCPNSFKNENRSLFVMKTMTAREADRMVFDTAGRGKYVNIEDLFGYALRGLLRTETSAFGSAAWPLCILLSVAQLLIPSVMRLCGNGFFLGSSPLSTVAIVCLWPTTLFFLLGNNAFICCGFKDMWRRRALMRSCAAMLSPERRYRKHCIPEVDMLPVLDLSDSNTIEGWRKLRQLCHAWGSFYTNRILVFMTFFSIGVACVLADLVTSTNWPPYRNVFPISLAVLCTDGLLCLTVIGAIVLFVWFGQEVNFASIGHAFLLRRHRLVLVSENSRIMPEKRQKHIKDAIEFLDAVAEDIIEEGTVHPIKLLGMYCGYSLLSALYIVPVVVVSNVATFCVMNVSECTAYI